MKQCYRCKCLFIDSSVGYEECTLATDFSDEEYEEYLREGYLARCPYFEKVGNNDY